MNSYNYSVCKKEGMNLVYLDYCANAPVEQQVLDRFYEVTKNIYANPNSIHKLGREAEDLLNKSADHIASYFNVTRDELIFTSGATESNNLAIKGICERYRNKGKKNYNLFFIHCLIRNILNKMFDIQVNSEYIFSNDMHAWNTGL